MVATQDETIAVHISSQLANLTGGGREVVSERQKGRESLQARCTNRSDYLGFPSQEYCHPTDTFW